MAGARDDAEVEGVAVDTAALDRRASGSRRSATFADISPIDETEIAQVARGRCEEVDRGGRGRRARRSRRWAAHAGRRARRRSCSRIADGVEARLEDLSQVETRDNGSLIRSPPPRRDAAGGDELPVLRRLPAELRAGGTPTSRSARSPQPVTYDPAGVVAIITPWNAPLMLATWRIGPALAAGNTVVVKPPEWAPLTASLLADITAEAGVPAGVFNVVQGLGLEAGAPLTAHPGINRLCFTGSVPTAGVDRRRGRAQHRRRSPSSSAASRRWSSSRTPTSTWRSTSPSSSSTTPGRSASAASGSWCTSPRSSTSSPTRVVERPARSVQGDPRDEGTDVSALVSAAPLRAGHRLRRAGHGRRRPRAPRRRAQRRPRRALLPADHPASTPSRAARSSPRRSSVRC